MNQLQRLFEYQGHQVRTIIRDGEPWFVLKDVCGVLDLAHRVVRQRLNDDVCSTYAIPDSLGRLQETTIINEDGLYDVILESRKPEARAFRKWITSEVLPSIRKTGTYSVAQYRLPQSYAEALRMLADEVEKNEKLEAENRQMKPKAEAYDVFLTGENCQSVGAVAKALGTGQNRLFAFLREKKILIDGGERHNLPYQRYIDAGYFRVKETSVTMGDKVINKCQTLVTSKGVAYISRLLHGGQALEGREAK